MGAGLLAMVCAITAKISKHASDKPDLDQLRLELLALMGELTELALQDALAYDKVVEAMRDKGPSQAASEERIDLSLKEAAEVPMKTAKTCAQVLEISTRVARLGKKSASSDIFVAILLAESGLKGAAANVRINIKDMKDLEYAKSAGDRIASLERGARHFVRKALEHAS